MGRHVYRNAFKIWEFGKEAPQNFQAEALRSERPLPNRQGASECENFEEKPTQPKTKFWMRFGIYRTRPQSWKYGKEAPQNFCSEQATIAERQGASENENYGAKLTQLDSNFMAEFGISLVVAFSVLSAATLHAWPNQSAKKQKGSSSSSGKKEERSVRFFLSGDFLYWRPDQTGMTYCLTTDSIVSFPYGAVNKEERQESKWGPGFRAGAGFIFPPAALDMSAYWTSFHHQAEGFAAKKSIVGTQLLSPISNFVVGGTNFGAGFAHSKWDLLFDVVELDFGYSARFKDRFVLRPYVGAAGMRINQKQTIKYNRFLDIGNSEFVTAVIEQKNDFRGAGPKLGISGDFCMGWGFGILGSLSAALFYGWANNPVHFHFEGDAASFPIPNLEMKYDQHRLVPAVTAEAGLSWERNFGRYFSLFLSAAYEAQYFWGTWRNQNSAIQNLYIADAGYGNLMLQGWTGRIKFTF